jgi:hypothetical protein
MARYNPHHDTNALFAVVEAWRDACLIGDEALLNESEGVWSMEVTHAVRDAVIGNPQASGANFLEKLRFQIGELGDDAIQYAAEALFVMLLFPSNIGPDSKRRTVLEILSWRTAPAEVGHDHLNDAVLGGIGSAGGGYNQNRFREFSCFLQLIAAFKTQLPNNRLTLASDPWAFARFLTQISSARLQTPHIVEHLLFPDAFERISSGEAKRRAIVGLGGDDDAKVKAMDREGRDRRLQAIRSDIAAERGSNDFDFYEPDLIDRWDGSRYLSTESKPASTDGAVWAEVTSLEHGHGGPGWDLGEWLWSPSTSKDGADRYSVMRKPKPGDRVFHFVGGLSAGQPRKRFLWGRSRVKAAVETVAERPSAPGDWGATDAYYKIALEDVERLEAPPFMDEIEAKLRDVILADLEERPKHYPYNRHGDGVRGVQGIYLSRLTPTLAAELEKAFPSADDAPPPPAEELEIPYGLDDAMTDLFMPREDVQAMLELWRAKSNLILQGAPGVGKSFVAKRLAYALLGATAPTRVETVQFHQSYAYEDFVQGYRPTITRGFELRDGVFLRLCAAARRDPDRSYVLIIDEVNRGNLSKVFGELMLLIEHDKRGADWSVRLTYAGPDDAPFHVPSNLYIIGMMNTADRSLSLVDYALRRRFAFVTLRPQFRAPAFAGHLAARGVAPNLVSQIIERLGDLNEAIASDTLSLGRGFEIGHSFFVPAWSGAYDAAWYARIIRTEIVPLLEEYWFDDPKRAESWRERLLAATP